ncbi:MAG: class II SORL domain-containing protein [Planctomycetota bacterium]|jgi:superoxide reductase
MGNEKDLLAGVNTPEDINNPTDTEKKHLPVIDAPDSAGMGEPVTVTVEVGKLLKHPNEPAHHIEWLDLYEDKLYLARADFTGGKVSSKVTFEVSLKKSGTLRAFACCNLHGVWEGDRKINVV